MELLPDPARVIAFVTFAAVVAGTPGPGNTLLTAVGARAGVRRGLPSLLGQAAGMGAMLFAITLGLGNLLLAHPLALQVLKWGGAALLCAMAWRIAVAEPSGPATGMSGGFLGMAAFQWVNPKGWL
ncbi:MAG: LysE family transporter, partial [Actinobacteria bacterium]|nr:LysE family transporter [Actinomycetota bacterium]